MKKTLSLLCVTVCIIISSCHKDTKVIPDDYYLKASKNNASWAAVVLAYTIPGDSLRLQGFKQAGEEQLFINIKFKGVGKYELTGNQVWFFTTIGMDVLTSSYRLDTSRTNSIIITSYSAETRVISGAFDLFLLKESAEPNVYVPLAFNGGRFRVRLPN